MLLVPLSWPRSPPTHPTYFPRPKSRYNCSANIHRVNSIDKLISSPPPSSTSLKITRARSFRLLEPVCRAHFVVFPPRFSLDEPAFSKRSVWK